MNVILYIILILAAFLGLCVGMFVIMSKYNDGRGDAANRKGLYKAMMTLGVVVVGVVVVLTLIYGLVPYQGETGFGAYTAGKEPSYWLSLRNIFFILAVEVTIGFLVILIARYRGSQNSSSRFADPQYLKQFNRKVMIWANVCMVATLIVLLLIKYVF